MLALRRFSKLFGSVPWTVAPAVLLRSFQCKTKLIGQSLSAFCTSSLEDVSSVGCLHSLSEAMLFLSLALFGLIRSKHLATSLFSLYIFLFNSGLFVNTFFPAAKMRTVSFLHNDKLYYICFRPYLSRVFQFFLNNFIKFTNYRDKINLF